MMADSSGITFSWSGKKPSTGFKMTEGGEGVKMAAPSPPLAWG